MILRRVTPDVIYTPRAVNHWPEPVRDCTGMVVRRIVVVRGEMTCTKCGETTTDGYCARCEDRYDRAPALVPTVEYLRAEEYREA